MFDIIDLAYIRSIQYEFYYAIFVNEDMIKKLLKTTEKIVDVYQ